MVLSDTAELLHLQQHLGNLIKFNLNPAERQND